MRGFNVKDTQTNLEPNFTLYTKFQYFKPLTDIFTQVKIEKKEEKEEDYGESERNFR